MKTKHFFNYNQLPEKVQRLFLPLLFLIIIDCSAQAIQDSAIIVHKRLPVISIAEGIMSFVGDVGDSRFNRPLMARSGFQVEVQLHTDTRFSFSLFLLSGKVFGDEKLLNRNLNFETGIVSEGVQFRYDFICKNKSKQILIPFVSAGIEYIVFHPKTDLKDANGNYYHYWKDGTIRSVEQTDSAANQAVIVHRDYNYETEMGDANIDGFGKFNQAALGFPIGAGARLKISNRCSMNFSAVCHYSTTDLIDGVSDESIGTRQGNSKKDKFIYSSISFRYDFSAPRETPGGKKSKYQPKVDVSNVDFDAIEKADADHDGVPDMNDMEPMTPSNAKVDVNGKAIDTDGDGIPDYRDEELNSAKDALVNEHGRTMTDAMLEEKFKHDSLAALPAIREYLKAMDELSSKESNQVKGIPQEGIPALYHPVDKDSNGIISTDEISAAIDEYLQGNLLILPNSFTG